ncbi:hypothetical protein MBLNU13_g11491t1 [Cladosporium sp. NU13]
MAVVAVPRRTYHDISASQPDDEDHHVVAYVPDHDDKAETDASESYGVATNGSNGYHTQSADTSTQSKRTNTDDWAPAIARFLAEKPRDSPWNPASMLPGMGEKSQGSKAN